MLFIGFGAQARDSYRQLNRGDASLIAGLLQETLSLWREFIRIPA